MTRYVLDTPVGYKAFWLPGVLQDSIKVHVLNTDDHLFDAAPHEVPPKPSFTVEEYHATNECIPVQDGKRLLCATIYRRKP